MLQTAVHNSFINIINYQGSKIHKILFMPLSRPGCSILNTASLDSDLKTNTNSQNQIYSRETVNHACLVLKLDSTHTFPSYLSA